MKPSTISSLTSFPFDTLISWYHKQEILPWQQTHDPYLVWISEIMLQQTTVPVIRERYPLWLTQFPTIQTLAKAELETVLHAFEGLGYYARARNLHKAALSITTHGWPQNYITMKALPGLGEYTSKTILSRCFNLPLMPFDVNIERFFARIFLKFPLDKQEKDAIEEALIPIQKTYLPEIFGQAIMRFAQNICKKREPQCAVCFFQKNCKAYADSQQISLFPSKAKKSISLSNYVILLSVNNTILLEKRSKGIGEGMFTFPRLSQEEYANFSSLIGTQGMTLKSVTHTYTHHREKLYPRIFQLESIPDWEFGPAVEFFSYNQLKTLPLLAVYRSILIQANEHLGALS